MHRSNIFGLALVASVLCGEVEAQIVQVGPGYVRAPFVRVYTGPGGGTRVQAPFVDVASGGYRRGFPIRGEQVVMPDFSRMNWGTLNASTRDAAARLDADLSRLPSGNFWRTSLKTAEIADIAATERDVPSDESFARLREVGAAYDSLSGSPEANGVTNLVSFQALRAALNEYSYSPEQRTQRQLSIFAGDLYTALQRFDTGATWQDHFFVSPGMALSPDALRLNEAPPTRETLEDVARRFDAARANPNYSVIANLPAFTAMHDAVVNALRSEVKPNVRNEELPRPAPPQNPFQGEERSVIKGRQT